MGLKSLYVCAVIRAMPNTPVAVNKGVSGLFANVNVSAQQKQVAQDLLATVGYCLWVEDEGLLDVITALSGSGPAYFMLLVEAMSAAAIDLGLKAADAKTLSIKTAVGAAAIMENSAHSPWQLRQQITSKKGTTEAAVKHLEAQKLPAIINDAMQKSLKRAQELSQENE